MGTQQPRGDLFRLVPGSILIQPHHLKRGSRFTDADLFCTYRSVFACQDDLDIVAQSLHLCHCRVIPIQYRGTPGLRSPDNGPLLYCDPLTEPRVFNWETPTLVTTRK